MISFAEYLAFTAKLCEEDGGAPAGGSEAAGDSAPAGEGPATPPSGNGGSSDGHMPPPPGGHGNHKPHHGHAGMHGHGHWLPLWHDRLPRGWRLVWIDGVLWLVSPSGKKVKRITHSCTWTMISHFF